MFDRRQLLTGVVGGLLGSVVGSAVFPRAGSAQQVGFVPLTDRLSLITTTRTNVLALVSSEGLVTVDSGAPELTERLIDAVEALRTNLHTAFNTHFHEEHTGGNEALRVAKATVVAHENTRLWMATPTWLPAEDRYRPPRRKEALPDRTFYTQGSMQAGGERIEYGYLLAAHTSGDIYVFFRDS